MVFAGFKFNTPFKEVKEDIEVILNTPQPAVSAAHLSRYCRTSSTESPMRGLAEDSTGRSARSDARTSTQTGIRSGDDRIRTGRVRPLEFD